MPPLIATSKKRPSAPFSLAKRRIYLENHWKEEYTDLFRKLPGYFLLPQEEQKEDGEHFANG